MILNCSPEGSSARLQIELPDGMFGEARWNRAQYRWIGDESAPVWILASILAGNPTLLDALPWRMVEVGTAADGIRTFTRARCAHCGRVDPGNGLTIRDGKLMCLGRAACADRARANE